MEFLKQDKNTLTIKKGFIPDMKIEPTIYVNTKLSDALFNEHFKTISINNEQNKNLTDKKSTDFSSFTQLANISTLPSLKALYGMPDLHAGYGFPIGSVAGFDLDDPECIVSPGGVGYDINCGVRCVVTSLDVGDVCDKELLADMLYEGIPSGTGFEGGISKEAEDLNLNRNGNINNTKSVSNTDNTSYINLNNSNNIDNINNNLLMSNIDNIVNIKNNSSDLIASKMTDNQKNINLTQIVDNTQKIDNSIKQLKNLNLTSFNDILEHGLEYLTRLSIIPGSEMELVESRGKLIGNSRLLNQKAKARGMIQLASLGSGNHYLEVQYVTKIFDKKAAQTMGIMKEGQILFTIHTGSRGVGHLTCGEYLKKIQLNNTKNVNEYLSNDLGCTLANEELGKDYLSAMNCASNFAFCNRALIDKLTRTIFAKLFPHAQMNLVYDVCHNIAKKERHRIDGQDYNLLVHRKGASRAFAPFHEDVPEKYKFIGQPVLVGGSMGTSSYILVGTSEGMEKSLGSACHGAGRLLSRGATKKVFTLEDVLEQLGRQGIVVRSGSGRGLVEEAPGSYKDVDVVAELCEDAGISRRVVQVKPFIVIKG